jgi:hypothetical protein
MAKLDITKIPQVMRSNQWMIGAQLLEKWFNDPANADPFTGIHDTTTVTMDKWLLTFPRVQQIYEEMLSQRIWMTDKAKAVIVAMLTQQGKLGLREETFGDFTKPLPLLDKGYIQYQKVGDTLWDPVDDLFAALGRFTLRMVIKGIVKPFRSRHIITIQELGIYARDSYDFNGCQHLGYWNVEQNYGGKNLFRGYPVMNFDFREWRANCGQGGDYLVFSDLKIIPLNKSETSEFIV